MLPVPAPGAPCRAAASEGSASSVGCAHRALCLTVVLALAQGMPLVVLLLAGRDRDLHLGATVLEVERQRHDGASALAGLVRDLLELGAVQEQLALAAGGVVVPRAVEVLGDVDVLEVELVAGEHREAVDERCPPHPQRLHLGAGQDDARLEGVADEVVVSGLAVARDERPPLLLGHRTILPTRSAARAWCGLSARGCRPRGAVGLPTLPRSRAALRAGFAVGPAVRASCAGRPACRPRRRRSAGGSRSSSRWCPSSR